MITVTRFDELTTLSAAKQRRVLHDGDPVRRIWAAWALALHLGGAAASDLSAALERDPDTGVRRHLVIILAGLGQRSLLEQLVANEADDAVRATAAQYTIQTSTATHLRPAITTILRDPVAAVRRSLLIANRDGEVLLEVSDLAPLIADDDAEVRELAVEALVRKVDPEHLFPGLLEDRLLIEPDLYLRARLMRLAVSLGRARRLLTMAVGAPPTLVAELARALVEGRQVFTWTDLAQIAIRDIPEAEYDLVFLVDEQGVADGRPWLLERLRRALQLNYPPGRSDLERANFSARCYTLLRPALEGIDPSHITVAERQILALVVADLQDFRKQMEEMAARFAAANRPFDWINLPHIQVRLRVLELLEALEIQPSAPEPRDPGTGLIPL